MPAMPTVRQRAMSAILVCILAALMPFHAKPAAALSATAHGQPEGPRSPIVKEGLLGGDRPRRHPKSGYIALQPGANLRMNKANSHAAGSAAKMGKATEKKGKAKAGGKDPLRKDAEATKATTSAAVQSAQPKLASADAEKAHAKAEEDVSSAESEFKIAEQARAAAKAAYANAGCDGANGVNGASSDCVTLVAAMQNTEAAEATKAAGVQSAQTKLDAQFLLLLFATAQTGAADGTNGMPLAYVEKALFEGAKLLTLGATVAVAAVPDTGTPLAYTVTLDTDLELNDGIAAAQFKADFATDVGAALAIDPAQVEVTSLKPGSLVVGFAVKFIPCATVAGGFRCDYVGDGYCDVQGAYNTAEHMYDGGDCCEDTCALGSQTPFYAVLAPERMYVCGSTGYNCKRQGVDDVPQFFDYGYVTTTATTTTATTTTTSTTTTTTTTTLTCNVDIIYTNSTRDTFAEELAEYFRDNTPCTDCNTAATSAVSTWPQLPLCSPRLPNFVPLITDALAKEVQPRGWDKDKTFYCSNNAGCPRCDGETCQTVATFGDLNTWDTSSVTNLDNAFNSGRPYGDQGTDGMPFFNQDVNGWDTQAVTSMIGTFQYSSSFDQSIKNWVTSSVTSMANMFLSTNFTQDINGFNTSSVTDMSKMFEEATFNQAINGFDTSAVTSMVRMFEAATFNQAINGFDTSAVTDMNYMFKESAFNQAINGWSTASVTSLTGTFSGLLVFNQNVNGWDTTSVTAMNSVFEQAIAFNRAISGWSTAAVVTLGYAFSRAAVFDQNINGFDTSAVTSMAGTFLFAVAFNQKLNGWATGAVTDLSSTFSYAEAFNQNINGFDTTSVKNLQATFQGAVAFNQKVNWPTGTVRTMVRTFKNAAAFNQNINKWSTNALQRPYQGYRSDMFVGNALMTAEKMPGGKSCVKKIGTRDTLCDDCTVKETPNFDVSCCSSSSFNTLNTNLSSSC